MSEPSDGVRSWRAGGKPEVPFLGLHWRRILTEGQGGDRPESWLVKEKGSDGGNTGIQPKETPYLVRPPMTSTSWSSHPDLLLPKTDPWDTSPNQWEIPSKTRIWRTLVPGQHRAGRSVPEIWSWHPPYTFSQKVLVSLVQIYITTINRRAGPSTNDWIFTVGQTSLPLSNYPMKKTIFILILQRKQRLREAEIPKLASDIVRI